MRRTSIEVYRRIRDQGLISRQQLRVYDVLFEHGPMTGSEVNRALLSKSAHKRLSELLALGVAQETGLRACSVTGERVTGWDVTDALPGNVEGARPTLPRPTPAQVRRAVAELRVRHDERPFSEETVGTLRWLKARFPEKKA